MFWQALTFLGTSFCLGENEVCGAKPLQPGARSQGFTAHVARPHQVNIKKDWGQRDSFSPRFLLILFSFLPFLNEEVCQGFVSHLQAARVSLAPVGSCPFLPPAQSTDLLEKSGKGHLCTCAHTHVFAILYPAGGGLSVRAWTEGIILDHVIIAASQRI